MTIKKESWLINTLTICFILAAVVLLWFLNNKSEYVSETANDRFYSTLLVAELRNSSEELTRQVRIYAATGSAAAEEAYNRVLAVRGGQESRPANAIVSPGQKRVLLDLLKEHGITDEEFSLVEKANALSDALVALEVESMNAVKGLFKNALGQYTVQAEPDRELALKLVFSDDYSAEVRKIMEPMNEFQDKVNRRTDEAIRDAKGRQSVAQRLSAASLAMVFTIALFNLFYNHFSITRHLSAIAETLKNVMVNGKIDLSKKIELQSNDEIGHLAGFFNKIMEMLQSSTNETKTAVNHLVSISEELSAISDTLASGAEESLTQSNTIAGTTEQMSVNMSAMASGAKQASVNAGEVAGAAEQMSVNMNTIAVAIEEMSAIIKQIADNTSEVHKVATDAMDKAVDATGVMNKLGVSAKEIGKVTDVIKNLANKTNLLALNATIEAASAGESGKGFAVVAGEIKELANQSAQSADDITRRVDDIQSGTSNAVNVIHSVSDIIAMINQSVKTIAGHVEKQTRASSEIASNVVQANTGAKRVADAIGEVARGVNDVSRNAEETAQGAHHVSGNVAAMAVAASETVRGANQINSYSGDLTKIANELKQSVNHYQ